MSKQPTPTRDHGGNLDAAMLAYGGTAEGWIDLSTGINPAPYAVPNVPASAWSALPRKPEQDALLTAATKAYRTEASITAFAGAQGAIQAVPYLQAPSEARVLTPTYNEHAAALRAAGWRVSEAATLSALQGAALAVVVNPNNPDGKRYAPAELRALAQNVGLLLVDESFVDPEPELSLAPNLDSDNIIVLRSFGKFYGLAGIRVGFALSSQKIAARLREFAGPWPVAGPSLSIAALALADVAWQQETVTRLTQDAARLDALAQAAGWQLIGGSPLFRTYATASAQVAQSHLAKHHIWSRIFPYSNSWIRLGLTHGSGNWRRLEQALAR
ncbi:threonine-phosphate decarboxylase CobD [Lentibacter algarum]|uniref:threonine-phosphate decarboxylase CobD n=1 Tax=Lentibacter algarum TaxID=576131 RepID=UPI001C079C3C|nr:threonine-phosphate decarboxylase CobD [Lentibacter algarum]MBU2981663.1 threonine-phosphate decarboxylase CobD [Lentibacter algarum]